MKIHIADMMIQVLNLIVHLLFKDIYLIHVYFCNGLWFG